MADTVSYAVHARDRGQLVAGPPPPTESGAYQHEFPFWHIDDAEWVSASALTNSVRQSTPRFLYNVLYTVTNQCHVVPAYQVPVGTWTDFAPDAPWHLFKATVVLGPRHGPFLAKLLSELGVSSLQMSAHQIWQLMLRWCALALEDLMLAIELSRRNKPFNMSRVKALLWTVSHAELFNDRALGHVFDLRDYWDAIKSGRRGAPVRCIRDGDERRPGLNAAGIRALQLVAPCPDIGIITH
jgi:hypothetical protein